MALRLGSDHEDFRRLFEERKDEVYRFLYRLSRNTHDAEDLLQEAFLRVWKAAPGWEPAAKVSTWIFKIAHNLYLNEAARRREKPLEGADETTDADPTADMQRAELGPRGEPGKADPARMTPQRRKKTPTDFEPGHTA